MTHHSRRQTVATIVAFFMFLGMIVWHQGDHIVEKMKPPSYHVQHGAVASGQSAAVNAVKQTKLQHPEARPKTGAPPHKGGSPKTKPRFWTSKDHMLPGVWDFKYPKGVKKIMGLIFFGRRQPVSILDCYLKRNLRKNGGMLDGVIFVKRTDNPRDLALLEKLLASESHYEKWEIAMEGSDQFASGFGNSYDRIEDDVMYIKIDDDVVFMEDSTIPSLVQKRIQHPEYYIVSANVVNQPLLSWVHWNLGAVKAYLPEYNRTDPEGAKVDWRASSLPPWSAPKSGSFDFETWEPKTDGVHRWLPVNRSSHDHILDTTPIEKTEYNAYGQGWTQWKIGAQEHFSFLEHLEKDELWHYKFGSWDFQYDRMGIQFVAMMGRDINIAKPIEADDENHFSCTMTRKLGRHGIADGRGIAVHYSFGAQREGMSTTDILERYRSFARENICEGEMLWSTQIEAEHDKADEKLKKKKQEEEERRKHAEEELRRKADEAQDKMIEEAMAKAAALQKEANGGKS